MPATTEHATVQSRTSTASRNSSVASASGAPGQAQVNTKHVVEAVQSFITLMDAVKINQVAVDQLHPMLADLLRTLNGIPQLEAAVPGYADSKTRLKKWLIELNTMRASDELNSDQARQFLFDLETAHRTFYRAVSE